MKSFSKKLPVIFMITLVGVFSFTITASASDSLIPEWVKNNAMWWSEGSISEADYITSLEYLITNGIINMPITEVTAAQTMYSDEERAQSFRVTISNIMAPLPVHFFEKFEITTSQVGTTDDLQGRMYEFRDTNPKFFLESLPSSDKKKFYDFVADWMNRGSLLNPFDVDVDILDGTGGIVQTWSFKTCEITSYGTYLQDIINIYQYSGVQDSEIRDRTSFSCTGLDLSTP